jgi:hypothetical protein
MAVRFVLSIPREWIAYGFLQEPRGDEIMETKRFR